MFLGIDLGTTRTVVAYADRGNYPVVSFTDADGDAHEFFPSVVAGPIERGRALLPQLAGPGPSWPDLSQGGALLLWGFFKKRVIADQLAPLVNTVFSAPGEQADWAIAAAVGAYAVQIYMDFSGYTDIATGLARLFGNRLSPNFDRPYSAQSIGDFWRRWHMSLSQWLRDYLFLPLAYRLGARIRRDRFWGLKVDDLITVLAGLVTMVLCGLWHGATAPFLVWGLGHGVWLALSVLTRKARGRLTRRLGIRKKAPWVILYRQVLTALGVGLLWVLFRSASLGEALFLLGRLPAGLAEAASGLLDLVRTLADGGGGMVLTARFLGTTGLSVGVAVLSLGLYRSLERFWAPGPGGEMPLNSLRFWVRWPLVYLVMFWILLFGRFEEAPFIYLQF